MDGPGVNGIWAHYWEIMSDPAHCLVEFTFVLLDYLVITIVGSRIMAHFHRDLRERDDEHGHGRQHSHFPEVEDAPEWRGDPFNGPPSEVHPYG